MTTPAIQALEPDFEPFIADLVPSVVEEEPEEGGIEEKGSGVEREYKVTTEFDTVCTPITTDVGDGVIITTDPDFATTVVEGDCPATTIVEIILLAATAVEPGGG